MATKKEIRGMLLHLGRNLWSEKNAAGHLRCDDEVWKSTTDQMAREGLNLALVDLGEGLQYPSHPELAVEGSWSVERMRKEIARLREMGIEAVPKLNFSATHDLWLKEYHRMISTPEYYKVCADLIRDVCEIFGAPRLIHLGFDEEDYANQRSWEFCAIRQGELWWHDFLWFVGQAEKSGMRPWIWSDKVWFHPDEFMKRMPRSVLQSGWYYGRRFDLENMHEDDRAIMRTNSESGKRTKLLSFIDMDKAGFDQVPCGANYSCEENIGSMVSFCRKHLSAERLKGFLMTSWYALMPDTPKKKNRARNIRAVELAGEAFGR